MKRDFSFVRRGGRTPIWRGFVSAVPWINAGAMFLLVVLLANGILVVPGTVVELPEGTVTEGMLRGQFMLMMPSERGGTEQTLLFFDEERYVLSDEEQMRRFAGRVRAGVKNKEVNLLADRKTCQGEVMQVVQLLQKSGVKRINIVEKPR